MSNRIIPYGYCVEYGRTVINESEAETVKNIFTDYLSGKPLKEIANSMTDKSVTWNKSRVFRILQNERYMGEKGYPAIISADIFKKANALRDSKGKEQPKLSSETLCLKEVAYCGTCGARLKRITSGKCKGHWHCLNHCSLGRYNTDSGMYEAVNAAVGKIREDNTCLTVTALEEYEKTAEERRLNFELARLNDQPIPSFDVGKRIVFALAAEKFRACKEDGSVYTQKIIEKTRSGEAMPEYIKNNITRIEVTNKGMTVQFINGARITIQGGKNERGKNRSKNRSKSASE